MANFFRSVLSSARAILQRKTATPTTSVQVITPDSGYDGLEQVTVEAVNLQSKTTTMTPPSPSSWSATTTKLGTVTPDSGYTGLSQADISIPMIPDNTTLSLQSSGTSYDTYTTGRGGYVFSNSYLRVPKSGGSETTLWENSSPSSAYSGGTITVSDMSNYKYIKALCYLYVNNTMECLSIVPYNFFKDYCNHRRGASSGSYPEFVVARVSNDAEIYRQFQYVSDTSIWISAGITRGVSSGQGSANNNSLIPYKIIGIN